MLPTHALDSHAQQWRKATIVAAAIAGVELVALVVLLVLVVARPLAGSEDAKATRTARTHATHATTARRRVARPAKRRVPPPRLSRGSTSVLVLNGNGVTGAAGSEAQVVQSRGYRVAFVGNARRSDYPHSVVMYRPGYEAEGKRLGRDLGIRSVSVVDGLGPAALKGAQVVVIVGG